MSTRLAGSSTDASDEQSRKAPLPMLVRPAGSSTDAIAKQRLEIAAAPLKRNRVLPKR